MAAEFDGDEIRQSTLYVQLHERKALGEPYHWALILTDVEGEGATIHHCTDRTGTWEHETKTLKFMAPTTNTLCLAGIGFVPRDRRDEAENIMNAIEILPVGSTVPSGELFNCRTWLKTAVHRLDRARVIRLIADVDFLETSLRVLAGQMVAERLKKKVRPKVYDRT